MTYKLAFIVGSGRSGSTVFEETLAYLAHGVPLGEIVALPRLLMDRSERCGCGAFFDECGFWQRVFASARLTPTDHERAFSVGRRIGRLRHGIYPRSVLARGDRLQYQRYFQALYEAVAKETGAELVIDASKHPRHVALMAEAAPGAHGVHLVRDGRQCVASWTSRKYDANSDRDLPRYPALVAAAKWRVENKLAAVIARSQGFSTVRFEDFAQDPLAEIGHSFLGWVGDFDFDREQTLRDGGGFKRSFAHSVSGNPSRLLDLVIQYTEEAPPQVGWLTDKILSGELKTYGYA